MKYRYQLYMIDKNGNRERYGKQRYTMQEAKSDGVRVMDNVKADPERYDRLFGWVSYEVKVKHKGELK